MSQITVSEAIGLLKTLKQRHDELKALRDENSTREKRYYGIGADKSVEKSPVYDVRKLDQTVNRLAMAHRTMDNAIKIHNATTVLANYNWDESVLGVIETETQ